MFKIQFRAPSFFCKTELGTTSVFRLKINGFGDWIPVPSSVNLKTELETIGCN